MNLKWYSLILIAVILISLTITNLGEGETASGKTGQNTLSIPSSEIGNSNLSDFSSFLAFQGSLANKNIVKQLPARKWNVLDPKINAEAVLVHSLDDDIPLFYYNTHESWTLASLSKLLTAVIVIEHAGINKKITISRDAVETEGLAGELKTGEVYTTRDLLRIMLLTSSNDAATAFEEYFGGKEKFLNISSEKINLVGMNSTIMLDGSGLSDSNKGTARDMLTLTKYILNNHPEIFNWTRASEFLVQPINGVEPRTIYNINGMVSLREFMGGKTGTSEVAGENVIALFTLHDRRIALIILGAKDRKKETEKLLEWVSKAYNF